MSIEQGPSAGTETRQLLEQDVASIRVHIRMQGHVVDSIKHQHLVGWFREAAGMLWVDTTASLQGGLFALTNTTSVTTSV